MIVLSRLCGNVSVCARAYACLVASSPEARQHWMLSAARSFFFKSTCRHLLHGDGLLLSNFPLVMITHKKKKVGKKPWSRAWLRNPAGIIRQLAQCYSLTPFTPIPD